MISRIEWPLTQPDFTYETRGIVTRRSVLPGGVRVLTDYIPGQRSTSIGVWVGAGSRDENAHTKGSTHFLEHLLFKGTATRTARDIADESDYLGGNFNAATSRLYTCYHGRVFDEDVPRALALLLDMVTASTLTPEDMDLERNVILEELAMYADDVSDRANEELMVMALGDHPLGSPIGGTPETVNALTNEFMREHYERFYRRNELVVVLAGDVNHEQVCDLVTRILDDAGTRDSRWADNGEAPAPRRRAANLTYQNPRSEHIIQKAEQSAVMVAMPSITMFDDRRSALNMLTMILGGGTSSRLFQAIREERGLAYSTYAFPVSFPEGGIFGMYAGCSPTNAQTVTGLMCSELERLATHGVSEEELESAFRRVRADLVFDDERNHSHMHRLGFSELVWGSFAPLDHMLENSRAVTVDAVNALAREIAEYEPWTVVVGPSPSATVEA